MNPIEELKNEHEAVRLTLNILNHICQQIESTGRVPDPDHLAQLFEFFSVFVDRCHHGKEEDLLFPALEAIGVSKTGGPIGVMLHEHQQGRDHVARMKQGLEKFKQGADPTARMFLEHARAYGQLLENHIEKENGVLFPMAARHLSAEKLAELEKGFERIESERVGVGKHEAFHRMLDKLKATYLKTTEELAAPK